MKPIRFTEYHVSQAVISQNPVRPPEEFEEFWGSVLGEEGEYALDDLDLVEWAQQFGEVERPLSPKFDQTIWEKVLKRCRNWKAPGRDGIQGFWLKVFPEMREVLGKTLWQALKHPKTMIG